MMSQSLLFSVIKIDSNGGDTLSLRFVEPVIKNLIFLSEPKTTIIIERNDVYTKFKTP